MQPTRFQYLSAYRFIDLEALPALRDRVVRLDGGVAPEPKVPA